MTLSCLEWFAAVLIIALVASLVLVPRRRDFDLPDDDVCPACNGTGGVFEPGGQCTYCNGTGR